VIVELLQGLLVLVIGLSPVWFMVIFIIADEKGWFDDKGD
jgi:hypothetical protein